MEGILDRRGDRLTLTFVRTLRHPPEKVWRALTEPQHLAAWFPSRIEGAREAGARLKFVFEQGEGPPTEGEMLTYDPPSVLEYRWDKEILRFELAPEPGACVLTFTDTFDELGKASRDGAGWHTCLDVLEYHLAGEPPPWSPREHWSDVHAGYVERLGPEASTIGPPEAMQPS